MLFAWLLTLSMAVAPGFTSANKDMVDETGRKYSPAEVSHMRHFFSIGEGFEGTASDWTEYIVWVIGVIGVFYYMANPNARRNMHAQYEDDDDDDPAFQHEPREEHDGDELFAEAPSSEQLDNTGHAKAE